MSAGGARTALRAAGVVLVLALAMPSLAAGADRIYWSNATANAVRYGDLDGSGSAATLFGGEAYPLHGIAFDPVIGKIVWANEGADAIRAGAIDGSGAASSLFTGESDPLGVAADSASGKVYWADFASGAIRVADADGSTAPTNLFTGESQPRGVAIDPAKGKIYWTSQGDASIRAGNLNGSGSPSTLYSGNTATDLPAGMVVDEGPGKIYWADNLAGTIVKADLDGGGSPVAIYSGEASPVGLALDPGGGKLYWASDGGGIRVGTLDGGVAAADLFPAELGAQYPAILRAPLGTARPTAGGGTEVGQQLSCTTGNWQDDDPGAFLYREPVSYGYQWRRNAVDVPGGTGATLTPSLSGSYTCTVTGANPAGSAQQTSDAVTIAAAPPTCSHLAASTIEGTPMQVSLQCSGEGPLTFAITASPHHGQVSGLDAAAGKFTYTPTAGFTGNDTISYRASNAGGPSNTATLAIAVLAHDTPAQHGQHPQVAPSNAFSVFRFKPNRRRGSGVLRVRIPGPGRVHVQGKGVQPAFDWGAGPGLVKVHVRPKGRTRRCLAHRRRCRVRVIVTYTPTGGIESRLRTRLALVKARRRR